MACCRHILRRATCDSARVDEDTIAWRYMNLRDSRYPAARTRRIVPSPTGTPGRAAHPESAGNPSAGSPEPTAPPAPAPRPGPTVALRRSGTSTFSGPAAGASRVAAVTIRCNRRCLGSSLARAASTARSAQSGLGRATCRRKTATSCRSTRISASLAASLRVRNSSQPNIPTMNR
jgi:hypothetical protein